MNKLNPEEENRLRFQSGVLVQYFAASKPENIRWISVMNQYALRDGLIRSLKPDTRLGIQSSSIEKRIKELNTKYERKYIVLDFELNEMKYRNGDGVMQEDVLNEKKYYADTEEELYQLLEKLGIDASKFGPSWKCDYPF